MDFKKFLIFVIMIFSLSLITFAQDVDYEVNQTVTIIGEYKESGVFQPADAFININLPDGSLDVNNENMTENSTGLFYYDYITTIDGEHTVLINFYNKTNSSHLLGSVSQTFIVGAPPSIFDLDGKLVPFECPSNHIQLTILIGFFILAFVFYGLGLKFTNIMRPIFLALSGFMMFILPFYIIACDLWLSVLLWVICVGMLFTTVILPFKKRDEDSEDYF